MRRCIEPFSEGTYIDILAQRSNEDIVSALLVAWGERIATVLPNAYPCQILISPLLTLALVPPDRDEKQMILRPSTPSLHWCVVTCRSKEVHLQASFATRLAEAATCARHRDHLVLSLRALPGMAKGRSETWMMILIYVGRSTLTMFANMISWKKIESC